MQNIENPHCWSLVEFSTIEAEAKFAREINLMVNTFSILYFSFSLLHKSHPSDRIRTVGLLRYHIPVVKVILFGMMSQRIKISCFLLGG
jgi:hypothetical protein